jgi:hypothetical protein
MISSYYASILGDYKNSGIYPREIKTYIHAKTCTQMFTAVLFSMAKY